jgi:hypothetical protein
MNAVLRTALIIESNVYRCDNPYIVLIRHLFKIRKGFRYCLKIDS